MANYITYNILKICEACFVKIKFQLSNLFRLMVTLNFKLSNLNKTTNRFYVNFETFFCYIYKNILLIIILIVY